MMCNVSECKFNSILKNQYPPTDCKFKRMKRYNASLRKVADDIGNAKRDEDGFPILTCRNFIKRAEGVTNE